MFTDNHYTFDDLDDLDGLVSRLEALHAESRTLSERINCVDTQIRQMLLRQRGSPAEPQTPDSWDGDDPPFHLVGA